MDGIQLSILGFVFFFVHPRTNRKLMAKNNIYVSLYAFEGDLLLYNSIFVLNFELSFLSHNVPLLSLPKVHQFEAMPYIFSLGMSSITLLW
jgi:hypothetical protein